MSDLHAIRWEFDRGSVAATAICLAEPGADCRLTSISCECEQWGEIQRRDDGTIWHHIVDYGDSIEPVWHEVKPMDDCNVCLFINESGCVEELGVGSFVIAETPIRPVWVDGGCDWEPAPTCRTCQRRITHDETTKDGRCEDCANKAEQEFGAWVGEGVAVKVTKPGLYPDLSELDYHADHDALSASGAKVLLGRRPPAPDGAAVSFGRLLHTVILEPHRLDTYAVLDPTIVGVRKDGTKSDNPRNTGAWKEAVTKAKRDGLTIIDPPTLAKAQAMAAAIQSHPEAARVLAQATGHEVSGYAEHPSGALVRGRFDLIGPTFLADIKTCRDGDPAPRHFDRVIDNLGYHISAANYVDIARANGCTVDRFDLICVENEPTPGGDYRVSVIEMHPDAIDKGRDLMADACARWLALGKRIDLPHYGDGRHVVDLPAYAYDDDFEDIQIGGAA